MTAAATSTETVIVIGVGSGIGAHLAQHYLAAGKRVIGTARGGAGPALDLNDRAAVERFRDDFAAGGERWNLLVVSVGVLAPIGPFFEVDFDAWERSFRANCVAQWHLVQALHPLRGDDATVIFFAGGAVNGVLENYSNYGVAKIALIKMVEYLQQEDRSTRYAILGPGWVPTKIHEQTLTAGERAGSNLERTQSFLARGAGAEYNDIAPCIDWIRAQPRAAIGGRNISVVHDPWGERAGAEALDRALPEDGNLYKLRRSELTDPGPAEHLVAQIFAALPDAAAGLARSTPLYAALRDALAPAIRILFSDSGTPRRFGPFGNVSLPHVTMGALDSRDLFGLDELIIFAFYWTNRGRYRRVADLGANIGLHSIILARCGLSVRAYEPDCRQAVLLERNLKRNGVDRVELRAAGVADRIGNADFARAPGSTISSQSADAKEPYGELERFTSRLEHVRDALGWADLIKMDAEGHAAAIFQAVGAESWRGCNVIAAIGSLTDAQAVYEHFRGSSLNLFSQKTGWRPVQAIDEMPHSYRDGSLFLSAAPRMPWSD